MPLNSRPQRLHHHFVADLTDLAQMAPGHDGLVVDLRDVRSGAYWIYTGGIAPENLRFAIDPSAASGQWVIS
jgi:hypothetical protein